MEAIPEDAAVAPPELLLPEERVVDKNADPGSDDEDQEPPATVEFTPTEQQLRDLKIAHDHAGHPSNADFARLLRRGNARPEVAAWVRKHFSCEACQANQ